MDCLGALGHSLYNKLCFGVHEAENDHGIMCVEWAAHGQPTVLFLGLLKTVSVGSNWTKNVYVWCV